MNPRNHIHLEGHVYDAAWSRVRPNGEAQVRFKLVVQRGEPLTDIFCCMVPTTQSTMATLQACFWPGRAVSLQGSAVVTEFTSVRDEPLILIAVESYQLDCKTAPQQVERRGRPTGKAAAAHDLELFEFKEAS